MGGWRSETCMGWTEGFFIAVFPISLSGLETACKSVLSFLLCAKWSTAAPMFTLQKRVFFAL